MISRAKSYLSGVRSGEILVGNWINLAVKRHDSDLLRAGNPDFPYYFDESEADRVLNVFPILRFSKGKETGQPFDIMPWFAALVYLAYGWRRIDGGRRFRKVYCKVARGNAKTANLVNIGTIGFLFDHAVDPEIYWVAMNQDQAKIGWNRQREALRLLVQDEPELLDIIEIPKGHTSKKISKTSGLSWVGYHGQDSDGQDGLSPYYVICDEYHAWDNDSEMNVMESGMVKVDDPVTWIITTAGYKPQGPNSQFLKSCKNMLNGVADNDELLAFIYELDDGDDWRDEGVWSKANPGLGVSVSLTGLRTEFNKIKTQGLQKEIDFKVKNLNIEYASQDGWFPAEVWNACAADIPGEDLAGRECWAGLDLASTNDFNAFSLFFPPRYPGDKPVVMGMVWITEDAIETHRQKRPFVPQWINEGCIAMTFGNVTDYDHVRADINEFCSAFSVQKIAYDRALSGYIAPQLIADGFDCVPLQQSVMLLTPAGKYLERAVNSGGLLHDGNPVYGWMLANVAMQYDRNGNYLPSKGKSADKIDFVAATLNAIAQWLIDRGEPDVGSSYLFDDDTKLITI